MRSNQDAANCAVRLERSEVQMAGESEPGYDFCQCPATVPLRGSDCCSVLLPAISSRGRFRQARNQVIQIGLVFLFCHMAVRTHEDELRQLLVVVTSSRHRAFTDLSTLGVVSR